MTATHNCPECQTPLPDDAPAGLCPRCLLQRGLGSDTSGTTTGYGPFAAPSVAELAPLFPQLEIIELLGQGGMGAVYKARQPGLDRLVALKILPQRDDAAFAERFTREARALAKLNHPGIVTVHDFGQTSGLYYFVMEFVEGVNLRQAERAGNLTPAEALAIVPQICAALQFAHDAGVVHRDIKPENILLDAKGRVKIADFGLAKLRGSEGPNPLTHTHQVMGTIHYMAPEQWEKPASVDHRADIYSLGVVFYELLTGELPLGRFPLPSQKVQIDVRLDDIVLRTLEKEPDRRYQHASDVKTDVEYITRSPQPERGAPVDSNTRKAVAARMESMNEPATAKEPNTINTRRVKVLVCAGFMLCTYLGITAFLLIKWAWKLDHNDGDKFADKFSAGVACLVASVAIFAAARQGRQRILKLEPPNKGEWDWQESGFIYFTVLSAMLLGLAPILPQNQFYTEVFFWMMGGIATFLGGLTLVGCYFSRLIERRNARRVKTEQTPASSSNVPTFARQVGAPTLWVIASWLVLLTFYCLFPGGSWDRGLKDGYEVGLVGIAIGVVPGTFVILTWRWVACRQHQSMIGVIARLPVGTILRALRDEPYMGKAAVLAFSVAIASHWLPWCLPAVDGANPWDWLGIKSYNFGAPSAVFLATALVLSLIGTITRLPLTQQRGLQGLALLAATVGVAFQLVFTLKMSQPQNFGIYGTSGVVNVQVDVYLQWGLYLTLVATVLGQAFLGLRMLEKQPERRYQHARDVKSDVKKIAEGGPVASEPLAKTPRADLPLQPSSGMRKSRRPVVKWLGLILLCSFVAFAILGYYEFHLSNQKLIGAWVDEEEIEFEFRADGTCFFPGLSSGGVSSGGVLGIQGGASGKGALGFAGGAGAGGAGSYQWIQSGFTGRRIEVKAPECKPRQFKIVYTSDGVTLIEDDGRSYRLKHTP